MLLELLLASALGAFGLATALSVRKYIRSGESPDLKAVMAMPARRLRKVLRRPASYGNERSRVVVQGPKIKPVICQICLGRVKEGLEYAKCPCGKTFHAVCLVRTGFCPYCDRAYEDESLPPELLVKPKITSAEAAKQRADIRMVWEPETPRACPICGHDLPEGGNECDCGAIIVEDGEVFDCPSCGTEVPADSMSCPACKESFEMIDQSLCPICGRLVPSDRDVCECGALASDACPECGSPLGPEELRCPSCGTTFEFA